MNTTTDKLVNDILDGLFTHLLDHVEAGHIEQLDADLARVRAWAERRYAAMNLSVMVAATREPREILKTFLEDCDRFEALVAEIRSRAAFDPAPLRIAFRTPHKMVKETRIQ